MGLALITLAVFNREPSCFDARVNGGERGVDCGGPCVRVCQADLKEIRVVWQRLFKVSAGDWSAAAYVENPNAEAEAARLPYSLKILDGAGSVILTRSGEVYAPPRTSFLVFESDIKLEESQRARVLFEFSSSAEWLKPDSARPRFKVSEISLTREKTKPRLQAKIENPEVRDFSDVEVYAAVYDSNSNAIAASRTFIEKIYKGASVPIVFTWPTPFETEYDRCRAPVDAVLAIDRSGSMDDEAQNPPEPLESAKAAAKTFVNEMEDNDQVSVVSFANSVTAAPLTADRDLAKRNINAVRILQTGVQYTNIGEAISKSALELSRRGREGSTKAVIVLTDGVASFPRRNGEPSYPLRYAEEAARAAKEKGIELHTIALGSKADFQFLSGLASSPELSYLASTVNLPEIYAEISAKLCRREPAVVEILPKLNAPPPR